MCNWTYLLSSRSSILIKNWFEDFNILLFAKATSQTCRPPLPLICIVCCNCGPGYLSTLNSRCCWPLRPQCGKSLNDDYLYMLPDLIFGGNGNTQAWEKSEYSYLKKNNLLPTLAGSFPKTFASQFSLYRAEQLTLNPTQSSGSCPLIQRLNLLCLVPEIWTRS